MKNISQKQKFTNEDYEKHYEKKLKALENILGEMHDLVSHAIIPFQIGGAVDMYYFPNTKYGMAFVTMELIEPDGSGPKLNNKNQTYEFIAFTREKYSRDEKSPFAKIERRICGIFTEIGNYSYQAIINPKDTCEIPNDKGENICLVFDEYSDEDNLFKIDGKEHTLLICIEVFRNEMKYAMNNGTKKLLDLLKENGFYPYSDMDRKPVIS